MAGHTVSVVRVLVMCSAVQPALRSHRQLLDPFASHFCTSQSYFFHFLCVLFSLHFRYTLFFSFEALSQKTAKAPVGFVISVRLSGHLSACLYVRPSTCIDSTHNGQRFTKFMSVRFTNIRRQIQVLFQSDKQNRYCT